MRHVLSRVNPFPLTGLGGVFSTSLLPHVVRGLHIISVLPKDRKCVESHFAQSLFLVRSDCGLSSPLAHEPPNGSHTLSADFVPDSTSWKPDYTFSFCLGTKPRSATGRIYSLTHHACYTRDRVRCSVLSFPPEYHRRIRSTPCTHPPRPKFSFARSQSLSFLRSAWGFSSPLAHVPANGTQLLPSSLNPELHEPQSLLRTRSTCTLSWPLAQLPA